MRNSLLFLLFVPFMSLAQTEEETILIGMLQPVVFEQTWATEWLSIQNVYQPNPSIIAKLKSQAAAFHFKIILGTWCSDSKLMVPAFLKVAELSKLSFDLVGTDRDKNCPLADCSNWDIQFVPTIIVLRGDKEVGRIVETVKISAEQDLLDIIEQASK